MNRKKWKKQKYVKRKKATWISSALSFLYNSSCGKNTYKIIKNQKLQKTRGITQIAQKVRKLTGK